jgi:ornithine carbamoyltransferase
MRVSSHDDINTFSQNANVPIINALSDESHPCQLLADMMTYKEHILKFITCCKVQSYSGRD